MDQRLQAGMAEITGRVKVCEQNTNKQTKKAKHTNKQKQLNIQTWGKKTIIKRYSPDQ